MQTSLPNTGRLAAKAEADRLNFQQMRKGKPGIVTLTRPEALHRERLRSERGKRQTPAHVGAAH